MTILFGASGAARDIEFMLYEYCCRTNADLQPAYIIAKSASTGFTTSAKIITEENLINYLNNDWKDMQLNAVLGIGSGMTRKKILDKFSGYENITFPTIIHPDTVYDKRPGKVIWGFGNLVLAGTTLTSNIKIGNNNHVNINCSISHDCILNDNITISPGVNIAGNVTIQDNVFIGIGSAILERIAICEDAIIGAGAVVNRNITEPGTYAGVPAKKIK